MLTLFLYNKSMCDIIRGVQKRKCKKGSGGNSKLYLFNYVENAITFADSIVTEINTDVTEVFEFDLIPDVSNFVEEMVSSRSAMTTVNTQTITAFFGKMDADLAATLNLVAYGFPIAVIKDKNDIYHVLGHEEGIDFNVSAASGTARADSNGFTLTGTSMAKELSPKLDESTITQLLGLVN